MLPDLLHRLLLPLPMEEQTGYRNHAVVGGTAEHFVTLTGAALDGHRAGTAPLILGAEFPLSRLHEIWKRYPESKSEERAQIVETSRRLIATLEGVAGPAAAASASLPVELAEPGTAAPSPKPPRPAPRPGGLDLDSDITYLKGIGPTRATLLAKRGVHTVRDFLYHFPARYEDRRMAKLIGDLRVGEKESFACEVLFPGQTRRMGGRQLTRVRVGDGTGRCDLQWWNQPYREKFYKVGTRLFVYGKVGQYNDLLQVDSPEVEVIGEGDDAQSGAITPVYPLVEGLYPSNIRRAMHDALERYKTVEEMIPAPLLAEFELMPIGEALQQIHFPDDWEWKEKARHRLVFEELFLLQLALAQKKRAAHLEELGIRHLVPDDAIKGFLAALPFKLTGAQRRVMQEVRKDLRAPHPMNRLLHGDVGSGKTVVAAYALWTAFQTGHQGALLAPTEILAEQHFSVLKYLLGPLGVTVDLLEGSLSARQKRQAVADLAEGRTHVVVGTHALIQDALNFHSLGVCVVDEQHRFGVMQRAALAQKGADGMRPDVLVMTATPIPRTMALTVYGDLDVSVLDELPPGRQPIKTVKIKPEQRDRAYGYVLSEVKKGRQAYVVCPLVEESESLAHLRAATVLAERLRTEELHGLNVGLVHGQLTSVEREQQMELFRLGALEVLVSTTVIEVGVDVPNATVMLIEDADRFGLSQLHQLRGRIGRGQHKSTCVLLANPRTEEGKARINVMTKTQDGFEIAERDLDLRGPGEMYGTRQSGMPDFRLADIVKDVETIQLARAAAWQVVDADPHLELPEHAALIGALRRFWGDKFAMVQVS